jgi:transcriptional regulator with XRE-family HTH domain
MGMDAVGTYIATLREKRGYTQPAFAKMLGISERGLRDWEKGRSAPGVDDLQALLDKLKGSWMHIALLTRTNATIQEAEMYAERQLQGIGLTDEQRAFIENLDPAQLAALVAVAEQMKRP